MEYLIQGFLLIMDLLRKKLKFLIIFSTKKSRNYSKLALQDCKSLIILTCKETIGFTIQFL